MRGGSMRGAWGAMLIALAGCGSKGSDACSGECTAAQYCDVVADVCVARVTEFAVGADAGALHDPHAIIIGLNGDLWFTETQPSAIGRITVDGVITEFATPTPNASPISLAVQPDGYILFLEGIGAVGVLTPAGVMKEYPFGVANNGHIAADSAEAYFTVDLADEIGRFDLGGDLSGGSTFTPVNGSPT